MHVLHQAWLTARKPPLKPTAEAQVRAPPSGRHLPPGDSVVTPPHFSTYHTSRARMMATPPLAQPKSYPPDPTPPWPDPSWPEPCATDHRRCGGSTLPCRCCWPLQTGAGVPAGVHPLTPPLLSHPHRHHHPPTRTYLHPHSPHHPQLHPNPTRTPSRCRRPSRLGSPVARRAETERRCRRRAHAAATHRPPHAPPHAHRRRHPRRHRRRRRQHRR